MLKFTVRLKKISGDKIWRNQYFILFMNSNLINSVREVAEPREHSSTTYHLRRFKLQRRK